MYLSRIQLKPDIIHNSQLGRLMQSSPYHTHQLLWDLFDHDQRDFLFREELAKEQLAEDAGIRGAPIYYMLSAQPPKADAALFEVQSKAYQPSFHSGQRLAFRLRANATVTRDKKRHNLVLDAELALCHQLLDALHIEKPTGKKRNLYQRLEQARKSGRQGDIEDWLYSYLADTRYAGKTLQGHNIHQMMDLPIQHAVTQRLIDWMTQNHTRKGIFSLCQYQLENEQTDEVRSEPFFQWGHYSEQALPEKGPTARLYSVDMSGELIVHEPERFGKMIIDGIGPGKAFGCGLMMMKPVNSY
ncbi:MAG: type I-E CRISPR-associated protein Cas6/Cse3/CasE [Reinekea sp.]